MKAGSLNPLRKEQPAQMVADPPKDLGTATNGNLKVPTRITALFINAAMRSCTAAGKFRRRNVCILMFFGGMQWL